MNPTIKNILAIIAGIIIGGGLNMAIILISPSVIPPPEGSDLTTMEGLTASMHLMEPKHFIMPFLAHALGALIGAFVSSKIAANNNMKIALGVSAWFMVGGIINVFLLPSPVWFTILDLLGAYIPMGYLGGLLAGKKSTEAL